MKERIYWLLDSFEMKAPNTKKDPDTGLAYDSPVEAINRVDFCIDFKTDKFEPNYKNLIGYKAKKASIHGKQNIDFSANVNGSLIETTTLGKLPNRQVTLYEKTREVRNKPVEKAYWWDIWGINPKTFNQQIWRVEARAGKSELKKGWNVTSFDDLEQKCGDIMADILEKYRYTIPDPNNINRNRWKNAPFWNTAIKATKEALAPYSSNAERKNILCGSWKEKRNIYLNNINGNSISLAALLDIEMTELPNVFDQLKKEMQQILDDPDESAHLYQKYLLAKERFVFLERN